MKQACNRQRCGRIRQSDRQDAGLTVAFIGVCSGTGTMLAFLTIENVQDGYGSLAALSGMMAIVVAGLLGTALRALWRQDADSQNEKGE